MLSGIWRNSRARLLARRGGQEGRDRDTRCSAVASASTRDWRAFGVCRSIRLRRRAAECGPSVRRGSGTSTGAGCRGPYVVQGEVRAMDFSPARLWLGRHRRALRLRAEKARATARVCARSELLSVPNRRERDQREPARLSRRRLLWGGLMCSLTGSAVMLITCWIITLMLPARVDALPRPLSSDVRPIGEAQ